MDTNPRSSRIPGSTSPPARSFILAVLAALLLVGAAPEPGSSPSPPPAADVPFTSKSVMGTLDQGLDWYRQARIVMRSVNGIDSIFFGRADE